MKVAILGVSHWHAGMHLDAMRHGGAEISAVWDEDSTVAEAFGRANDAPAAPLDEALSGADLVVLMGHPSKCPAHAMTVIEARKPMVLEKPAVSTTAELERIVAAADAVGMFAAVPLPNRFGPAVMDYVAMRDAGRTGHVAHAGFRLINGPPERYRDDKVGWLLDPAIGGGGALRNLGIHGFDTAIALAQGELRVVSSHIGKRIHKSEAVEDHAVVVLTDEADALYVVESGYTYASMAPGGDFEWRIVSDTGVFLDTGDRASAILLGEEKRVLAPEPTATRYRIFARDVLSRLEAGKAPSITLRHYLTAMRLMDTAYEKALS